MEAAISRVQGQLPPNMPSPPTFQKVNPADQPIYFLALSSNTLPISTVDEYAETLLGQRISMVKGVAQVQVFGSQKYAVRIQLDPQALASRQIGIDEVTTAVQNANVNLPTGTLYGKKQAFTVQANGQLTHASLYRPLIVAYRNGSPVRLDELGTVSDSVQKRQDFELLQRRACGNFGGPTATGHEHRGHRGRSEKNPAAIQGDPSSIRDDDGNL